MVEFSVEPFSEVNGQPEGDQADTVPEFLADIINCKLEDDPIIKGLANRQQVALLAFIAPRLPVRVGPAAEARARIGLFEEFGVEALVEKLQEAGVEKAYLLVNSPGGAMDSSYKIASAIQSSLKEVTTFVPHVAASGGTLLSLIGKPIVMGPMSHITPLDVQVVYKDTWVSAASGLKFFDRATREWFSKAMPDEVPYPQRALTEALDPVLMEEWTGSQGAMIDYVQRILDHAGYGDKAEQIAKGLVEDYPTHSYVINLKEAERIGLNVASASNHAETWKVMRHWLGKYLITAEMRHCIRFVVPEAVPSNGQTRKSRRTQTKAGARG